MVDNVIENQTGNAAEIAVEKPVRKRASRRVTAPAGEAATVTEVTVAAPAAAAEAPAAEAPASEAPAEAPKKRVTRSRKKAVEAPAEETAAAAAPQTDATVAADAATGSDSVEAPAEAPKKRVTRSRKKAVEPEVAVEADAPAEAATEQAPAAAEEAPAEPVKRTRRTRATKPAKDAEAPVAEGDAQQSEAAQVVDAQQASTTPAAEAAAEQPTPEGDSTEAAASNDADAASVGEKGEFEKSGRTRTRNRRGQKTEQAENGEAAGQQAEASNGDAKNQRGQRAQKSNGSQGPADSNKQNDSESRSSRTRQRDRKRRGQGDDIEPEITEDDVLLPIAGILDILENYAFVRTSGYLPGTSDVYVSLGQVKKYGMKRGDAVVGAIRQPRDGEASGRQKYNAIVKVDSVNGRVFEENEQRVELSELSAIYPERQLKLANGSGIGSQIDSAAPVGFGQRGILVVPQPARGVDVLSQLAESVSVNAPDAHLMLVLANAQPEDITHLTRSVKGEVVAASFERAAEDQATIAELAIDRAKRLAELGHDVVVLVDSIGDLARAYAQVQPTAGRPAHGEIDEFAVSQLKRVLGAARNAENGGSLTVLVTAAAKTGNSADKQLLRELRKVANSEIRLAVSGPVATGIDAERSYSRGAGSFVTAATA